MKQFLSAAAVALAVVAANQSAAQTITLLHRAVGNDNMLIAEFLILDDASMVNAPDEYGWTPLHGAVQLNNLPMAQLLIDNGAAVNVKYNDGDTPLHRAVIEDNWRVKTYGYGDLSVAQILIENGADLIAGGADVNAKALRGWTPLHIAAALSVSPDIVKLLIDNGADVNAEARLAWTPLRFAARNGNFPIAQLLIENGADVDVPSLVLARDNPAMLRLLEDNRRQLW